MRNFQTSILSLLLCLALAAPWAVAELRNYEVAADTAAILTLDGVVTLAGANGVWRPAMEGSLLREGESVQTGPSSSASIVLGDQTVMKLAENSRLTVIDLRSQESGNLVRRFQLHVGRLWSDVTPRTHPESVFEVRGSQAVAAVKGTAFEVSADDTNTEVTVFEGAVDATRFSDRSMVSLRPGRQNSWSLRKGQRARLFRKQIQNGDAWQKWNWQNRKRLQTALRKGKLNRNQVVRLRQAFKQGKLPPRLVKARPGQKLRPNPNRGTPRRQPPLRGTNKRR